MTQRTIDRRRLLALGSYGMVLSSLSALSACGGGGAAGDAGGGNIGGAGGSGLEGNGTAGAGTAGAPLSSAQRLAALDEVSAAMAQLMGGGLRFDSSALAQRLAAMPAFQRVGISSSHQNVWALFTDGRALVVPNNLDPVPPTASGSRDPAAAATGGALRMRPQTAARRETRLGTTQDDLPALLTQAQYRQLDMFGQVPVSAAADAAHLCQDFVGPDTLPNLRRMAMGRGFVLPDSQRLVPPDQGHDNGVEGLRQFIGDGVFFITACSAEIGADAARTSVICIDTPADAASETRYAGELGAGMLTYAVTMRGVGGSWAPYKCLAMTPAFVGGAAAAWSFPVESVAILNLSGGSVLPDWGAVLHRCGLNNILTWDRPVSWRRMLGFADDLLQMLLATNNLEGSTVQLDKAPRLRAYGVGETLTFLIDKHLTVDADGANQANYVQAIDPPLIVNTLLPTIDYVNIDEGRGLIGLVGQFGAKQGDVSEVRWSRSGPVAFAEPLLSRAADGPLGGADALRDPEWFGDSILSTTEPDALMRGGYIQVINGGRCSNAVQITHWQIPMRIVSTITGGLTIDATVTLHLRADMRGYRLMPDGPRGALNRQQIAMNSTWESNATYVASGQIEDTQAGLTTTISWSGGGSVGNVLGEIKVACAGLMDWTGHRLMNFTVLVQGGPPFSERTVKRRGAEVLVDETLGKLAGVGAQVSTTGPLELIFDNHWQLLAGNVELASETVDLLGTRTVTTTLSWAAAVPDFPPEDTVGGV